MDDVRRRTKVPQVKAAGTRQRQVEEMPRDLPKGRELEDGKHGRTYPPNIIDPYQLFLDFMRGQPFCAGDQTARSP